MNSNLRSLELPAFELDCRDWLVATPEDGSAPEDIGGSLVVAVLSTIVIGSDDITSARAVLTVGLLEGSSADDEILSETSPIDEDSYQRVVIPAPDGQLALLAEFSGDNSHPDLANRFQELMASFRWAA